MRDTAAFASLTPKKEKMNRVSNKILIVFITPFFTLFPPFYEYL